MPPVNRSLIMRANRLLGAQLVENNLVKIEDLEKANERLLEVLGGNMPRQISVLGILAFEHKVVREEDILAHVADHDHIGLIDLAHYDIEDELKAKINVEAGWATWSVPIDREEDVTFIATAYYLSPAVRKFWEETVEGPILWYGTTMEGIADLLESLQSAQPSATGAMPEA